MGTKCMGGTEGHEKSFPKTEKRLDIQDKY